MSLIKATGIISDHLGATPVAGIGMGMGYGSMGMGMGSIPMGSVSMGYGPMGFGAIRPTGSLGGLMPVSFDSKTRSVLHPAGMPIATTLNPFNPYDKNSTIVSNPFGGLSGLTGINSNFGLNNIFGTIGGNTKQEIYKNNGVDVIISGSNTDVKKVIECLDAHLLLLTAPASTVTVTAPAVTAPAVTAPAVTAVTAPAAPKVTFASKPTIKIFTPPSSLSSVSSPPVAPSGLRLTPIEELPPPPIGMLSGLTEDTGRVSGPAEPDWKTDTAF